MAQRLRDLRAVKIERCYNPSSLTLVLPRCSVVKPVSFDRCLTPSSVIFVATEVSDINFVKESDRDPSPTSAMLVLLRLKQVRLVSVVQHWIPTSPTFV